MVVLSCFTSVAPRPVDSRLRGNDGEGRVYDGRLSPLPLWIADQVRNDGADGWNDAWRTPPCGYCLEASMTAAHHCPSGLRIKSAMTVMAKYPNLRTQVFVTPPQRRRTEHDDTYTQHRYEQHPRVRHRRATGIRRFWSRR